MGGAKRIIFSTRSTLHISNFENDAAGGVEFERGADPPVHVVGFNIKVIYFR